MILNIFDTKSRLINLWFNMVRDLFHTSRIPFLSSWMDDNFFTFGHIKRGRCWMILLLLLGFFKFIPIFWSKTGMLITWFNSSCIFFYEFEKWRAIRASVGGVGGALTWVTWVECLRGWHGNEGDVVGVLAWVRGWCASVGGLLKWIALVILK